MKKLLVVVCVVFMLVSVTALEAPAIEEQLCACVKKNGRIRLASDPSICKEKETYKCWGSVQGTGDCMCDVTRDEFDALLARVEILEQHICIDNDSDAYGIGNGCLDRQDCDDDNPNVHPEAPEVCDDGVDNNCDGIVDCIGPYPTCEDIVCPPGAHCEMQDVVCITTPCPPMPVCVPDEPECRVDSDCVTPEGAQGACLEGICEFSFDCDTRHALCDMIPPTCPPGLMLTVVGGCYGPCVEPEMCYPTECSTSSDCPEGFECVLIVPPCADPMGFDSEPLRVCAPVEPVAP